MVPHSPGLLEISHHIPCTSWRKGPRPQKDQRIVFMGCSPSHPPLQLFQSKCFSALLSTGGQDSKEHQVCRPGQNEGQTQRGGHVSAGACSPPVLCPTVGPEDKSKPNFLTRCRFSTSSLLFAPDSQLEMTGSSCPPMLQEGSLVTLFSSFNPHSSSVQSLINPLVHNTHRGSNS